MGYSKKGFPAHDHGPPTPIRLPTSLQPCRSGPQSRPGPYARPTPTTMKTGRVARPLDTVATLAHPRSNGPQPRSCRQPASLPSPATITTMCGTALPVRFWLPTWPHPTPPRPHRPGTITTTAKVRLKTEVAPRRGDSPMVRLKTEIAPETRRFQNGQIKNRDCPETRRFPNGQIKNRDCPETRRFR